MFNYKSNRKVSKLHQNKNQSPQPHLFSIHLMFVKKSQIKVSTKHNKCKKIKKLDLMYVCEHNHRIFIYLLL